MCRCRLSASAIRQLPLSRKKSPPPQWGNWGDGVRVRKQALVTCVSVDLHFFEVSTQLLYQVWCTTNRSYGPWHNFPPHCTGIMLFNFSSPTSKTLLNFFPPTPVFFHSKTFEKTHKSSNNDFWPIVLAKSTGFDMPMLWELRKQKCKTKSPAIESTWKKVSFWFAERKNQRN